MTSKHFLGLCLFVGGSAAFGLTSSGCGKSDPPDDGTGGSGGSDSMPASKNHDFSTASDIEINGPRVDAVLIDTKTPDFFKFTGKAGQKIFIGAFAQSLDVQGNGFDATIADVVVTLFDANKNQIAQADDMWPAQSVDSQLFTVLPADGEYFISVGDCHSIFLFCGQDRVAFFDYSLLISDLDKLTFPDVAEGMEPNETEMAAKALPYKVSMSKPPGDYGFYILDGAFTSDMDIDAFSLTIPSDTKVVEGQRAHANFWLQPVTKDGTGATSHAKVWLVDAKDMAKPVIALADQTNYSDDPSDEGRPLAMSVPVELDHPYTLFVQHAGGMPVPATDFYFMVHFVGSYEPETLEKSPDANDTAATAEPVTPPKDFNPGQYFVDGNISVAGTDVDHYLLDVSSGATTTFLACNAQRAGSGLRGAKFSLLKADGSPLGDASSVTEVPNADAFLVFEKSVPIPAGETKIILKVEAASQDPAVTGTYYHCFVRTL